jgi:HlyD family secretion protein
MQVHMNVAEADIGRLAVAQDATFSVDAYPETRFEGRISAIRNSPTTIQNVVTYEAVIDVDNEDLRLKPGMTANVSVVVDRREDALRVPNAALRFRPPEGAVIAEREQEADGSAETRASSAPGSPGPGAGEPGESVRGRPEGGQARRGGSGRGRSEDQEPPVSGRGADEAGPGAGRWPNAGREGPSGSGGGRRGPGRGGPPRSSVWMVEGTGVRRVSVSVGITDGAFTEIVGGGIEEGDEVVTEIAGAQSAAPARTTRPGFGRLF